MAKRPRIRIGLWSELPPGARWTNEGVSRVVGFLIEGAAQGQRYHFSVIAPYGMGATVRADLASLEASEGEDWSVYEGPPPSEGVTHAESMVALAHYANAEVQVAGWVVTFPFFKASVHLKGAVSVLFPDAIPFDFPSGWPGAANWGEGGHWDRWFRDCSAVMNRAGAVITFSQHVADRHVRRLFDVPASKIHVVPLAPPDLSSLVPFTRRRLRTGQSRVAAARVLREHARERGWRYLADYPFEEACFTVVSTQDRPTKNIGAAAAATLQVLRCARRDLKLFVTAPLHYGADWTQLPGIIEGEQAPLDIVSVTDLPRPVHAALYHCAAFTLHPSFYEGIVGALPFFESISVGTPSLLADGPHTRELLADHPGVGSYVFDPYDINGLAGAMLRVMDERPSVIEDQIQHYEHIRRRTWADVAEGYAAAALNLPPHDAVALDNQVA